MGSTKWVDEQFGQRVKQNRERKGWTQQQMAAMLAEKGIQPMHATTVAKIEAGDRSVRINEAVGIANLFEMALDALVGRPDDTSITFALTQWMGYAETAQKNIGLAQGTAADIIELVDDGRDRFDLPAVEDIHRAALTLGRRLEAAQTEALRITALATDAIINNQEPPARRRSTR
jgi:transcriptional regulator with XRE-family HTH domain